MRPNKLPVILVIDNVRSLHNIGSIFRTADGANIEEIVLGPLCPAPPRHEIEKTALGATKTVAWKQVKNVAEYIKGLHGYTKVALEQSESSKNLHETEVPFPVALVVGHEREGVSEAVLDTCDIHIHLPMNGSSAKSLNVANATAITLYELMRRSG